MPSRRRSLRLAAAVIAASAFVVGCPPGGGGGGGEPLTPQAAAGERLFLETRFAQFYFANSGGDVNAALAQGDPTVAVTVTRGAPLAGPFAGESMNCRVCRLLAEHRNAPGGGVRTYADFARRSPIPAREDGRTMTPRNSPALVDASLSREAPFLLHFDAEFATAEDLVVGTYTGRNFGWLAEERGDAVAHIARVIREDDGLGALAGQYGGIPYADLFAGLGDPEFALPAAFQTDVDVATDEEVVDAAARLVAAYMDSLVFHQDGTGRFDGSPYDVFLAKNGLPRAPGFGETDIAYSRRLRGLVGALPGPVFVTPADGTLTLHDQPFVFGPRELQGLRVFLAEPRPGGGAPGGAGNCLACHAAPTFSDFRLHNIGTAQAEYDALHGDGAFAALDVPTLAERNADPDLYLAPSAAHPRAEGIFRAVPSAADPSLTDLGLWNVFANPAIPGPQAALRQLLCAETGLPPAQCTDAALLPRAVARFKTPGLRDLGQSAPYFHTGQANALDDVVDHYRRFSQLARQGMVPNAAPELGGVDLQPGDIGPLVAFLRSLNEDYE